MPRRASSSHCLVQTYILAFPEIRATSDPLPSLSVCPLPVWSPPPACFSPSPHRRQSSNWSQKQILILQRATSKHLNSPRKSYELCTHLMIKVINHYYQVAVVSVLVLTLKRTMSDGTEFSKRDKTQNLKSR